MGTIASQITSLTSVYSIVYSDADQRKYQSSASLAFVRGIHRRPVNSPHKGPVTQKMFPFDHLIMITETIFQSNMTWTIQIYSCIYFKYMYIYIMISIISETQFSSCISFIIDNGQQFMTYNLFTYKNMTI